VAVAAGEDEQDLEDERFQREVVGRGGHAGSIVSE
jgi:hypothetical protein